MSPFGGNVTALLAIIAYLNLLCDLDINRRVL